MTTPRIIFLDFDGVLNHELWYKQRKASQWLPGDIDLSRESVALLNGLVADTGAKVVVTSTWRLGRTTEELQATLDAVGFEGEVLGKTVDARIGLYQECVLRGNEVLFWMQNHENYLGCSHTDFKSYVILDDDSDFLLWQQHNFIHVDRYCGLTPNVVFKAKKILSLSS
jgi:hypothetical protein